MGRTILFGGPTVTNARLSGETLEFDAHTIAALRTYDTLLEVGPRRRFQFVPGGSAIEIGPPVPDIHWAPAALSPELQSIAEAHANAIVPAPLIAAVPYERRLVIATNSVVNADEMCDRAAEICVVDLDTSAELIVSKITRQSESLELYPCASGIYVIERAYRALEGFDQVTFVPWHLSESRWSNPDNLTIERWFPSGAVAHLRIDERGVWTCGTDYGQLERAGIELIERWAKENTNRQNRWFNEKDARGFRVGVSTVGGWHCVEGEETNGAARIAELVRTVSEMIPKVGKYFSA